MDQAQGRGRLRVLFVCTGNTCRSPMAAVLFRQLAQEMQLDAEADSAGVHAVVGDSASEGAHRAMNVRQLSLTEHVAKDLAGLDPASYDLLFTMTENQHRGVLARWPEVVSRLHVLKEYVGVDKHVDVSDPFGGSDHHYEATARELESVLRLLVARLKTESEQGEKSMRIAIGCDHAGFTLKPAVLEVLQDEGCQVIDCGTRSTEAVDYPDYGVAVGRKVASGEADLGIALCGTGIGISIAANKIPGVRAALCHDTFSARMSRAHNDANVLALGSRVIGVGVAQEIVRAFLHEEFAGKHHAIRVDKLRTLDQQMMTGRQGNES